MTPEDEIPLNRLERGRDLTERECDLFLADRQTALRHGTAPIAVEVADTYRERAVQMARLATEAQERVRVLEAALRYAAGLLDETHPIRKTSSPIHRAILQARAALGPSDE